MAFFVSYVYFYSSDTNLMKFNWHCSKMSQLEVLIQLHVIRNGNPEPFNSVLSPCFFFHLYSLSFFFGLSWKKACIAAHNSIEVVKNSLKQK